MNRNEILEKLKEILLSADESSRDTIHLVTEQTHLLNDLGLSSVNMLYMIIATEEVFGIRFDDKDALFSYEYSLRVMSFNMP